MSQCGGGQAHDCCHDDTGDESNPACAAASDSYNSFHNCLPSPEPVPECNRYGQVNSL